MHVPKVRIYKMIIIESNFSGNMISETTNMYAISQNHYDKYFKPIIMINMLTQYAYTDTTSKKWFASKNEIYYTYIMYSWWYEIYWNNSIERGWDRGLLAARINYKLLYKSIVIRLICLKSKQSKCSKYETMVNCVSFAFVLYLCSSYK